MTGPGGGIARMAALKNLGPKSAAWLVEAGVDTPDKLANLGAVEAYRRVRAARGGKLSLVMLWALHGALEDRPYNRLSPDTREMLKSMLEDA